MASGDQSTATADIIREAQERQGRIAGAAIRLECGRVISLPPPARHHDVIRHALAEGVPMEQTGAADQGFVTTTGLWARRKPALRIAQRHNQLVREPTAPAHGLFSEDVW